MAAASARLCVETQSAESNKNCLFGQLPPRGCVLKPALDLCKRQNIAAAAFGWLCVETF